MVGPRLQRRENNPCLLFASAVSVAPNTPRESVKTSWSRVAFGVGLSAFVAYQQFKLPPVLPGFLAEHPHDPIVAAGFMSIYALVGLLASAAIGGWLVPARWKRGVLLVLGLSAAGIALALDRKSVV